MKHTDDRPKRREKYINDRPNRKEKRIFIQQYKLDKGCSVCGYSKSSHALDLDHIDRTKKNFSMSKGCKYSWEKIIKELENCVVLCANCHREKTDRNEDYFNLTHSEEEEVGPTQIELFEDFKDETN